MSRRDGVSNTSVNNQQQQQQPQPSEASLISYQQEQQQQQQQQQQSQQQDDDDIDSVYRNGLVTVGGITLLFASNSPAVHAAFSMVQQHNTPPVLLLNAAVACVALMSVKMFGPVLDKMVPEPSLLTNVNDDDSEASISSVSSNGNNIDKSHSSIQNWFQDINMDNMNILAPSTQAGMELGLWKFLGCTANLYGLSQTSAGHGAFLIQLTTLLVPAAQGMTGVAIPARLWSAIALALAGVFVFTQDTGAVGGGAVSAASSLQGDALCVVAAIFYATYDLRLFQWGQRVAPLQLITNKVTTQAALSVGLLAASTVFGSVTNSNSGGGGDHSGGLEPILDFFTNASPRDLGLVGAVTLWSGMIVNGIVPYLQVGGQQAVGPARAQILYASQPLWAALLSFVFLGETVGPMGAVGGTAFLAAMATAATAEQPGNDDDK
jgi:drug/metabolite transporter (DMT)-like permease